MYKGIIFPTKKKNELFQQKSLTFWPYHLHQLWSPLQKYGSFSHLWVFMTPWCILHDPTYKASSSDSPPEAAWCGKHLIESPSCSESGALLSLAGCGISGAFNTHEWVDVVDVYISYWKLGWFFQLYIHVGFFGGKYISIYHFRHLHKTDRSSWKKTGMPFL